MRTCSSVDCCRNWSLKCEIFLDHPLNQIYICKFEHKYSLVIELDDAETYQRSSNTLNALKFYLVYEMHSTPFAKSMRALTFILFPHIGALVPVVKGIN